MREGVRVGKVIWHTMMSLDGFIAGPNDDMQWVFGVDEGERPDRRRGRAIDGGVAGRPADAGR